MSELLISICNLTEMYFWHYSSSDEATTDGSSEEHLVEDIHSIDVQSAEFLSLPAEVRHDILTELKDTRKQSSWKHLDQMPKESNQFSGFQMERLLRRHAAQKSLDQAGKEMGGRAMSLRELEELLEVQGVLNVEDALPGKRIAQDSVTRYMLIQKDLGKKTEFKLEEHLQDVEWSSGSDMEATEVKKEVSDDFQKVDSDGLTQQQIYDLIPKKKIDLLSKEVNKPKLSQDISDILTMLEDDEEVDQVNPSEVVVEKSKNLSCQQIVKESEIKQENMGTEEAFVAEESTEKPKELLDEEPKLSALEGIVSCAVQEPKILVAEQFTRTTQYTKLLTKGKSEKKKVQEEEFLETELQVSTAKKVQLRETHKSLITAGAVLKVPTSTEAVLEDPTEAPAAIPVTGATSPTNVIRASEFAPSSSESENEFIEIEEETSLASEKGAHQTGAERLEIVIDTSIVNHADDIFADVFEPLPVQEKKSEDSSKTDSIDHIYANVVHIGCEAVDYESSSSDSNNGGYGQESLKHIENDFNKRMTERDLLDIQESIESEHSDLLAEQGRQERNAQSITDQMCADAQVIFYSKICDKLKMIDLAKSARF